MRKFLVVLCSVALVTASFSPVQTTSAATNVDLSDEDGDIIENPWDKEFEETTEAPSEEVTTEKPSEKPSEKPDNKIVITTQPKDTKVSDGTTAKFTVVATGEGLTYQWSFSKNNGDSWTNISTGKEATLEVEAKPSLNGALYRCLIKDAAGNKVYTNSAKLSLNVIITKHPTSTSTRVGEAATFSITAEGEGLVYMWQYSKNNGESWTTISNSNSATIQVIGKANLEGAYYRCRVRDSAGKYVFSKAAKLTLISDMAITKQPVSASAKDGETATFTVVATGKDLKYLWYVQKPGTTKWLSIGSGTGITASLVYKMKGSLDGCSLKCRIKDETGKQIFTDEVKFTMEK